MDISKASNFERFVFDLLGRDGARVKALFSDGLSQTGQFDLSADPAFTEAATKYGFVSGKSTHTNRLDTIRTTFEQHDMVIDTHTADGLKVALDHRKTAAELAVPMIVLETALPIKFASTIVEALGREPDRPAGFEGIEALPKRVLVMDADVVAVKALIEKACAA
jgi:threonine synthase